MSDFKNINYEYKQQANEHYHDQAKIFLCHIAVKNTAVSDKLYVKLVASFDKVLQIINILFKILLPSVVWLSIMIVWVNMHLK